MSTRTPDSPVSELAPTAGAGGGAAFDVAATLRRIEAVLATLEGSRAEPAKKTPSAPRKRISFDWG